MNEQSTIKSIILNMDEKDKKKCLDNFEGDIKEILFLAKDMKETFDNFYEDEFKPARKEQKDFQDVVRPFIEGVKGIRTIRWVILWSAKPIAVLGGLLLTVGAIWRMFR